jgi:hypothetical protein
MDTRQIMCCMRDVSSILVSTTLICFQKHSIARSGILIINTNPHSESGSHWLAFIFNHVPSQHTISIRMACLLFLLPYKRSSDAIAPSGITTRYNCKDLLQLSVANIAVSSPCTWIEVILRNNSRVFFPTRTPTSWFPKCSSLSLDSYARHREEVGSASSAYIKGKSFFGHVFLFRLIVFLNEILC